MRKILESGFKILNVDWRYQLLRRTGHSFFTEETSGKTLEFIGTSGVGKSTLFRESVKKLRNRWFFAYHIDCFNRTAPPCELDEILVQVLKRRIEKINNSESFCPWHSLLDLKQKVGVMHQTMLVAYGAHPKGFSFDEGLFQHFSDEILKMGDEFPAQLWENRAFVYLRARMPETALSRIVSRETKAEAQGERQRLKTDDQILSRIVQDQEMFQSISERAPSLGCPVLVIDAENSFQDSIKKVLDFESSLSQRFKMQEKMETTPQSLAVNR